MLITNLESVFWLLSIWYFWFCGPKHFIIMEVEHFFPHFTTKILLLQEKCIELTLWILITSISFCYQFSNNLHTYGENIRSVKKKKKCNLMQFLIYIYISIALHLCSKERASPALSFIIYNFFTYTSYFSSYLKKHYLWQKIWAWKFHEHFDTSKAHENWYIEVFGHADHESGQSFLINLIVLSLHYT